MDPQLISGLVTALGALAGLVAALFRGDSLPKEVRLLARLAEAAGHAPVGSSSQVALNEELTKAADHYAARAAARRDRKVNKGAIAAYVGALSGVSFATYYAVGTAFEVAKDNSPLKVIVMYVIIVFLTAMSIFLVLRLFSDFYTSRPPAGADTTVHD